jgi:HTH-type transcriptional regulator/antitoxin HipB
MACILRACSCTGELPVIYPLKISSQLTPYLKALRMNRGMTQAQLGQLLGVTQARVAEIEANPGTVSLQQILRILHALDASLAIHDDISAAGASQPRAAEPAAPARKKAKPAEPAKGSGAGTAGPRTPPRKGTW